MKPKAIEAMAFAGQGGSGEMIMEQIFRALGLKPAASVVAYIATLALIVILFEVSNFAG
jgi:hypothetical protein